MSPLAWIALVVWILFAVVVVLSALQVGRSDDDSDLWD